jgi:signal peptidase I
MMPNRPCELDRSVDVIIVKGTNATEIEENDVVIFDLVEDNDTTRTVHRVVGITTLSNGTRLLTTKGDNNTTTDPTPVPADQVYGQVIYRIPLLGYLALDPMIPFAIVIVAVILILIWPERGRKKRRMHHSLHRRYLS